MVTSKEESKIQLDKEVFQQKGTDASISLMKIKNATENKPISSLF